MCLRLHRRLPVVFILILVLTLSVAAGQPARQHEPRDLHNLQPTVRRTVPEGAKLSGMASVSATVSEGFEGAWPATGWSLYDVSDSDGGEWLMGKRACHPQTGSYALWTVGGGGDGGAMVCQANYVNDTETWAIYGPFDLSSASSATLGFGFYGESEYLGGEDCETDYLYFGGSTNGSNYSGDVICGAWLDGSDGNGYTDATVDFSRWLGESQVWFAFQFVSDYSDTSGGFHIDNVWFQTDQGAQPTATSAPVAGQHRAYLPINMRMDAIAPAAGQIDQGGGVIGRPGGPRLHIPQEAVPAGEGGAPNPVAFSIDPYAALPASLPNWVSTIGSRTKISPDSVAFAYPVGVELPLPSVGDLAQLSVLHYDADDGAWRRMPKSFQADDPDSVFCADYELGTFAVVSRPSSPDPSAVGGDSPLKSSTPIMPFYDGALRVDNNALVRNNPAIHQPVRVYLKLEEFTPKYPWQGEDPYAYDPDPETDDPDDWIVLWSGTKPDGSPADETIHFMYQGTYKWCVSVTEYYVPPSSIGRKWMYSETVTTVLDEVAHNTCQVFPCWENVVDFPVLDPNKWSENEPCTFKPGDGGTAEGRLTCTITCDKWDSVGLWVMMPDGSKVSVNHRVSPDGSLAYTWGIDGETMWQTIANASPMPVGTYGVYVGHGASADRPYSGSVSYRGEATDISGSCSVREELVHTFEHQRQP